MIIGLGSAVDEYMKNKVAIVGTPCQIRAVRKMQTSRYVYKKLADAVSLTIGLFCMESYSYTDLMNYLENKGITPSDITRFDIKKGRFKVQIKGEEILNVPLKDIKQLVRPCCNTCPDFTAELADISVGGMGCPEGWSTIIVRTEKGETALLGAENEGFLDLKPIEDVESDLSSITKLSKIKRKREKN
jgi:Coenzyme F420-reducing hydrogenase, beta subunit